MFETGRGPAGGERACPVRGHPHAVRGTGRNRPIRVMIPGVRGQEAGPCPRSGSSPCLVGPSGQDRSRHPSESSPWRGRSVGTVLGAFRSGASPPCGADSRRDPMPILAPGCSLVCGDVTGRAAGWIPAGPQRISLQVQYCAHLPECRCRGRSDVPMTIKRSHQQRRWLAWLQQGVGSRRTAPEYGSHRPCAACQFISSWVPARSRCGPGSAVRADTFSAAGRARRAAAIWSAAVLLPSFACSGGPVTRCTGGAVLPRCHQLAPSLRWNQRLWRSASATTVHDRGLGDAP